MLAAIQASGVRYEVCNPAHEYTVTREGKRELTEPELLELRNILLALGSTSAGTGGVRCRPANPRPGAVMWVDEKTVTPVEISEHLVAFASRAGGDPSVRVQVTILSAPGPRCAADDPACGPVPYQAMCVEQTDYDPKGARTIVQGEGATGQCKHDGECVVSGCGNECAPAAAVGREGTCEDRSDWDDVYCGCVKTTCSWFTTK